MSAFSYKLVNEETVSAVTASPSVSLMTRRLEGANEYLYVYNAGNSQIVPGYGVIASAMSLGSGTLSAVGGEIPLGIVKNATITTGTYGWVVTRGPVHVYATDGLVFGGAVMIGANGVFGALTVASASVTPGIPIGTCIGTAASANTGAIQLRAL
jgi:hypothetical protein